MSNITNVMNGSQVTMSSREIAELTDKQHKNVLRDIRDMVDTLIKDGSTMSHEINQQVMIE